MYVNTNLKNQFKKFMDEVKERKFSNKKRVGFTLIEMIITVTIIGILASMAAVNYFGAQDTAKKNVDYASAANIATAAQMAIADGENITTVQGLCDSGYLQSVPKVQQNSGGSFTVHTDGRNITVKINGVTYYPKQAQAEDKETSGDN